MAALVDRREILAEARKWLGTPWRHQGRVIGHGCDCAGLVVCVGRALGMGDYRLPYRREAQPEEMGAALNEHLDRVKRIEPGNVLWFAIAGVPRHLAIATDEGMIHAYQTIGNVAEHRIDHAWMRRLVRIYSYRGVARWQP